MKELYLVKCADPRTPVIYYVEEIAVTLGDAIEIANKKDNFGVIEIFSFQNDSFKSTKQYFNKYGQQTDFSGRKIISNDDNFESEINDTLRIAGIDKDKERERFKKALDNYAFWN